MNQNKERIVEKINYFKNKTYQHRYIIALVILVILVSFEISGSSISLWNIFLSGNMNEGVIFGKPVIIRTDEWKVSTIMTFSQYHNDFKYTSNLLRGTETDLFIVAGMPVKDISMIFRIFTIGYLFLSPSKGLSLFWWSRLIALFLATFEFAMLITNRNKKLSFVATMLVTFAPTVQWWFATNFLIEMIVAAEIALILLDKYLKETKYSKRLLYSLIIFICLGNFILCIYPAWLIPMFYIFLPFLIWVIVINKNNLRFSKKDIITLIFEFIILALIISRVFIKSYPAILSIMNTAYPGKRIENGGGQLHKVTLNNLGALLPFYITFINQCELATFVDFWPITIILIAVMIIKEKKKDLLLILMLISSVFLNIYCIIGLPDILAKVSLLSFSTSDRVSGVVGLLNIFVLIRTITLIDKNYFDIKNSIIISGVLAIYFGIIIYLLYSEIVSVISVILVELLFAIIYFLLLNMKEKKYEKGLLICVVVLSVIMGATVNPIRGSADFLLNNELGNEVKRIAHEEEGLWITEGIPGDFCSMFGARTLNSINTYPNLDAWHKLDKDLKYEEVYNRYAHINIYLNKEQETTFELVSPDAFEINTNLGDLNVLGVKYILTEENYDNGEVNTENHKLDKIYTNEKYNIYKINEI